MNENRSSVKNLFHQTLIYGIGLIVSKTINFILLPVYTNFFTSDQLGLYNLVFSFWAFTMVFYSLGLETSFIKFFTDKKTHDEKSAVYSTVFAGTTITGIIFSTLIFFLSDNIAQWLSINDVELGARMIRIVSLVMIVDLLYRFPMLLLRCELRAKMFLAVSNLFFFSNLILNILFVVVLKYDIESIFYSYLISSVIALIAGIAATKDFIRLKFNPGIFKKMIVLGSSFILMGFFLIITEQSDKFFLNYFFNESVVGIYSTCYRLGSIMLLAIMAFKLSWTPYFLGLSRKPESKKHISNIFTYYIFAGIFLFLLFYLFIGVIAKLNVFGFEIINMRYWSGLKVVPVVLISFLFSGLYLNFSVIPLFADKSVYLLWISLCGCLVNIICNLILIPRFEMMGAAYATLISYVVMFIILYSVSQKFYFIDYEWKKIFVMALIAITICTINFFIPSNFSLPSIALNVSLLCAYLFSLNALKIIKLKNVRTLFVRDKSPEV